MMDLCEQVNEGFSDILEILRNHHYWIGFSFIFSFIWHKKIRDFFMLKGKLGEVSRMVSLYELEDKERIINYIKFTLVLIKVVFLRADEIRNFYLIKLLFQYIIFNFFLSFIFI